MRVSRTDTANIRYESVTENSLTRMAFSPRCPADSLSRVLPLARTLIQIYTHTITSRLTTGLTLLRGELLTVWNAETLRFELSNACIRLMRETFPYLQTPSLADIALRSASHGCRTQAAGSRMCNRAPPHRGQIVLDLHTTNVRWSSSQVWIPLNIQPSTAPFTGRDAAC